MMIRTEAEYQAAKKEAAARQDRLHAYRQKLVADGLSADELKRALGPLQTFALDMNDEIERYERLRSGDTGEIAKIRELGKILIALRISKNMTQRELAARLGVDESQVSRDERHEYHGAKIERVSRVLAALEAANALLLTTSGAVWLEQSYVYENAPLPAPHVEPVAFAPRNDNLAVAA